MTDFKKSLRLCSWLIVLSIGLIIPIIIGELAKNEFLNVTGVFLSAIYTAIWVYVYMTLKSLLNNRFKDYTADTTIDLMLIFGIISAAVSAASRFGLIGGTFLNIVNIFMLLALGVSSILFGIKFLNLKNPLYETSKTIGLLRIISGICYVSILLMPIGLIFDLASDIMFAIFFDRAANDNG